MEVREVGVRISGTDVMAAVESGSGGWNVVTGGADDGRTDGRVPCEGFE